MFELSKIENLSLDTFLIRPTDTDFYPPDTHKTKTQSYLF